MNRAIKAAVMLSLAIGLTACAHNDTTAEVPSVISTPANPTPVKNHEENVALKAAFSSPDRQQKLQQGLHVAGQELFAKILDGGIPYGLQPLAETQKVPPSTLPKAPVPVPANGWVQLVTNPPTSIINTDAHVSMTVHVSSGKVDRDIDPIMVSIHGHGCSLTFTGQDAVTRNGKVVHLPSSAYSWSWNDASDGYHGVMAVTDKSEWPPTDVSAAWDVQVYDLAAYTDASVEQMNKLDDQFVAEVIPALLRTVDGSDWL